MESYYEMTGRNGKCDGEESRASQDENVLQTIGNGESEMVSKSRFHDTAGLQSESRLGKK